MTEEVCSELVDCAVCMCAHQNPRVFFRHDLLIQLHDSHTGSSLASTRGSLNRARATLE